MRTSSFSLKVMLLLWALCAAAGPALANDVDKCDAAFLIGKQEGIVLYEALLSEETCSLLVAGAEDLVADAFAVQQNLWRNGNFRPMPIPELAGYEACRVTGQNAGIFARHEQEKRACGME